MEIPNTEKTVPSLTSLNNLNFDNSCLKNLPLDPVQENYVRRSVANSCFSIVKPTPVSNPKLVGISSEAMALLDIDPKEAQNPEFAEYFSGNKLLKGSETAAHCYCGFQFGYFSGQLGDGRAMYLGEVINQKGERWEIQLKGAGRTPYSRDGDGRAVLRSSIREFLCSEAMFHLGVPTTRAGTVVTSDTYVIRDLKYDGNPIKERASLVLRIAPTFLRFGSFQICLPVDKFTGRAGPSAGQYKILLKLLKLTLKNYYPHISGGQFPEDNQLESQTEKMMEELTLKTARMVSEWQCVGFGHGVLNTDNMSILGLTIDYGPFGFMEDFNPFFICNASDTEGRYSYKNQPSICLWNLKKFAEAIQPALPEETAEKILAKYMPEFEQSYLSKMRKKLGLLKEFSQDKQLVESLLEAMETTAADFTNTFRNLNKVSLEGAAEDDPALELLVEHTLKAKPFVQRLAPMGPMEQLKKLLETSEKNPAVLSMFGLSKPMLLQEIQKGELYEKLKNMTNEEKKAEDKKVWTKWLSDYKQRLKKDAEGVEVTSYLKQRVDLMNANNPKIVLRNYIAQLVIEKAEKGDYSELERVMNMLKTPFAENEEVIKSGYDKMAPEWAESLCVT